MNTKEMLDRMPLQYRAQIEAEVNVVWEMKRQAVEDGKRLRAALSELLKSCPRNLECQDFDHRKTDWHNAEQPCNPRLRYEAAIEAAESLIN